MILFYNLILKIRPALVGQFLKKVFLINRKVVKTSHGSFYIDPVSNFGFKILKFREYEKEVTQCVKNILEEGDVFVDLGANEGFFTVIASSIVKESGLVICIEPQSRLQSVIQNNLFLNNLENILLFQVVISDKNGFATLSISPDTNTGSSGLIRVTKYKNDQELCIQKSLNSLIKNLNISQIKLMKIDIEGFEYEAILGSKGLFKSGLIKNIALEIHPWLLESRGKKVKDIIDYLESVGYRKNMKFDNLVFSL